MYERAKDIEMENPNRIQVAALAAPLNAGSSAANGQATAFSLVRLRDAIAASVRAE
jgi:hypothetical protein